MTTLTCRVMGFSRQEYQSGLPCPPAGDLLNPETEPVSLTSPALAGGFFTTSATCEATPPQNDTNALIYKVEVGL